MLKIKHLASAELFATTKFSADSSNTTYFIGNNTTQIAGIPDVLYEDLVFCKGCDLIYTHGHFYGNQPNGEAHVSLTQEEYDALSEEEKNNGKIYLIKDVINPDDLTVSGDATIAGSLTVGDDTITGIDDSINPDSNNPVKNSAIYNLIQNPIHYFYNANTPQNQEGNKESAIQYVLNDIMPKFNASGDIKFAVIRHQGGFAFLYLIANYFNLAFIAGFGFSTNDLITYQSTLSNGTWGTVSRLRTY